MRVHQARLDVFHNRVECVFEMQGQQVPDPPPIPDFKPGFTKALENSVREVSVTLVRKVYEIAAVRRLGIVRAEPFLRDYKNWIRDVLAFKYRCGIVVH